MIPIPHIGKLHGLILLAVAGVSLILPGTNSRWMILTEDSQHPHAIELHSIAFTDQNHGWALNAVELWETEDGGVTWNPRLAAANRTFYSLMFANQNSGWIVGVKKEKGIDKALVMLTVDGGKTWVESSLNIATSNKLIGASGLQSVSFCDANIGWAVGADLIIRSTDGGQTWEKQRGDNNEVLYGVQCINASQALAVGMDGLILSTDDGGKTWLRQDGIAKATLTRVRYFNGTSWILGGLTENGFLLKSVNGISDWEQVPISTSETPFDIYMSGREGWVVGGRGTILHTNDGGQSWLGEKSPTENNLTSVFFLTPRRGWIGGSKLTVLKLN